MFCQIEVVQNGVSIQSRALRARRHRQDASRGRVGQARVHARDTGRVLHRDRAAHAAAPRETGAARRGAPADRQGEAPGHRRVRLHADRPHRAPRKAHRIRGEAPTAASTPS